MVVDHGGHFVHDPSMWYTGRKVSYFDLCHVEAMSMLDIWDMMEELGYAPTGMKVFWRIFGGCLRLDTVRPLVSDFDVLNLVASMPRNRYLHIWLVQTRVEDGGNVEDEPPIEMAFESENEDEGQNAVGTGTLEGEDENVVDVEVENAEDRRENEADDEQSVSDFYESDYDMVDPDDNMVEVRRNATVRNTGIGSESNQQARPTKKARTGNQPMTQPQVAQPPTIVRWMADSPELRNKHCRILCFWVGFTCLTATLVCDAFVDL
ncbi:hypothetical protein PTKIN_Ptkin03bG0090300 [Pterospermum kingtungense]